MEKVTGIASWAFLNKPNTKYDDDGKWSIDIECDKATLAKLKKLGINLVEKQDGRIIFAPSRNVLNKKDKTRNEAPVVYDKYGNVFTGNIGNGSQVEVAFSVFDYKRIKGKGGDLCGVKILELVPYEDKNNVGDAFEFEAPEKVDNMFD